MTEGDTTRLIVWSREIRQVHARLRQALALTRAEVATAGPARSSGDVSPPVIHTVAGMGYGITGDRPY